MIATSGVLFRKAEKAATGSIILIRNPFCVFVFLNMLSKTPSITPVLRITSPISRSIMMTSTCWFENPAIISRGVRMPKRVRKTTPMTKVKAGPTISSYSDIRMNIRTRITRMESKVSMGEVISLQSLVIRVKAVISLQSLVIRSKTQDSKVRVFILNYLLGFLGAVCVVPWFC